MWTQFWLMSSECWRLTLTFDIIAGMQLYRRTCAHVHARTPVLKNSGMCAPLVSRKSILGFYCVFVAVASSASVTSHRDDHVCVIICTPR